MSLASSKLALLNNFRQEEGLAPFKDWRSARHQPMLDAYEQARADAEYAARKAAEEAAAKATRDAEAELERKANIKATVDRAKANKKADANADATKSYKSVANYDKSAVESPVAFVHAFLDANASLTRKQAVVALTETHGVNYSTARTQYQRWFTKRKAPKGK